MAETTDSASAFNRKYIPGLRDGGTMKLSFRHDPADNGQIALSTNFNLDTSANVVTFVLVLPSTAGASNKTYTFDGFVVSNPAGDLGLTDDTVAELSCDIQVTGAVTIS